MKNVQQITDALKSLRDLPTWGAGWAGDIAWFQFGQQVQRPHRRGGPRVVGEYALHISSAWRWCASSGFIRADETSDLAALQDLSASKPHFVGAERGPGGALVLRFDNGDTLAIDEAPDPETLEDEVEYWRLLQPGLQTPHLVVSSNGVEWHEA